MRRRLVWALSMVLVSSIWLIPGRPASAGSCATPISSYFFYGGTVQGTRVLVGGPARVDVGREACIAGSNTDAFVVPPGVGFVRAELQTPVGALPTYCVHGLGISMCGLSERISPGYAKTDTHALDPTVVSGGFVVTFHNYGTQTYRTLLP